MKIIVIVISSNSFQWSLQDDSLQINKKNDCYTLYDTFYNSSEKLISFLINLQ